MGSGLSQNNSENSSLQGKYNKGILSKLISVVQIIEIHHNDNVRDDTVVFDDVNLVSKLKKALVIIIYHHCVCIRQKSQCLHTGSATTERSYKRSKNNSRSLNVSPFSGFHRGKKARVSNSTGETCRMCVFGRKSNSNCER